MPEKPRGVEAFFTEEQLSAIRWAEGDEIDGAFRRIARDVGGVNVYRDITTGELVKITCEDDEERRQY